MIDYRMDFEFAVLQLMAHSGELMESLEETKSEAKISQKSQRDDLVRPVHKYSIENDINKLFDSIDIKNAYKALVQSENYLSDAFSKSAMKRPMRVGSSHASGIGISESASLKQALRRLCISHASEMAATKMQLSKSTPFTGISKAGSTKSLYRAVVFEANEDKGNLVQVSLVPETNASASSIGILPSLRNELKRSNVNYTAPSTDAITQKPGATETPPKDIVGRDCLYARSKLKKKLKLCNASVGISSRTKLPALDENVCHSVDVPFSSGAAKAQEGRSTISELTFVDGESSAFKSADNNPHFVRPVFRRKNIVNKRLRSDSISPSGGSSRCNSGVNTNSRDGHCGGSCWSPDSSLTKGYKENDVSPESSSLSEVVEVSTTYVVSDVNKRNYGHKTNVRSRSREKGKTSLSSKSSIGDNRSSVSSSDESVISSSSCRGYRPHMSKDLRWKAINCVEQNQGSLGWKHFKLLRKLGGGDIGNIYLSELIGTNCLFALKVMDIGLLASRSKLTRAQTEKEILQMLDHPFLPSLYRHFTTDKFSCLLMEYCPGGDLHVLRQKQLARAFSEQATRFYIAEVVLALEYLHMLGVVYRDLKPENVLVREDGHIMLTDFDLSLRCAVNLTMLKTDEHPKPMSSSPSLHASCIGPFRFPTSLHISCFNSKFLSVAAKTYKIKSEAASQARTVPELIVEPTDARSNSFVGTHEYLAPEIIKGEGHGSAVDWWTLGILLYELLYGKTPFKAQGDEDTLINIASGCLKFPETPTVSSNARDLIRCLLQKEPQKRLGFEKGSAEIKQHKFFQGLNWALIRCTTPPHLPKSYDKGSSNPGTASYNTENERSLGDYTIEEDIVLEMF